MTNDPKPGLSLTNMNGISADDEHTCALNDMNCLETQGEKTFSIDDMNAVAADDDTSCALDNMNCVDKSR